MDFVVAMGGRPQKLVRESLKVSYKVSQRKRDANLQSIA